VEVAEEETTELLRILLEVMEEESFIFTLLQFLKRILLQLLGNLFLEIQVLSMVEVVVEQEELLC
jgi:hypothetical protein